MDGGPPSWKSFIPRIFHVWPAQGQGLFLRTSHSLTLALEGEKCPFSSPVPSLQKSKEQNPGALCQCASVFLSAKWVQERDEHCSQGNGEKFYLRRSGLPGQRLLVLMILPTSVTTAHPGKRSAQHITLSSMPTTLGKISFLLGVFLSFRAISRTGASRNRASPSIASCWTPIQTPNSEAWFTGQLRTYTFMNDWEVGGQ